MIHYMGGGVIKDPGSYTFVKVRFGDGTSAWYIAEFAVDEGDKVIAPRGRADMPETGTAEKVERGVSGQITPVPLRSAKKLLGKSFAEE